MTQTVPTPTTQEMDLWLTIGAAHDPHGGKPGEILEALVGFIVAKGLTAECVADLRAKFFPVPFGG